MSTIQLTKAIDDGKITELTIAEPTFKQLQKHGLPFDGKGIDFAKAADLLEACTGVQKPFLDQMSAKDSLKAITALAEMLGEDVEK